VASYDFDYSAMSGGTLMVAQRRNASSINGSSNGGDIAVSPDGTRLYTATGAPYVCSSVDPQTLGLVGSLPGGSAYPNNVEVTQDGRVICGVNGIYSTFDFWVHTAAGALISGYKVVGYAQGLVAGQLVVTPDSFVVVTLTTDPRIAFVAIGP
jgi:DNA-binding beta-propeller fold protein YncE